MFRFALVCAALIALCACGQHAPGSQPPSATDLATATIAQMRTATPPTQFVARAAMFENYQIQAAQIAQQSAQSSAAKTYAAAALVQHQATLQQLNGAVQASGMAAPGGALDENYNAYLDMLRHADAPNFDAIYASQQTLSAISASGLYDSFTSTAVDSPLRQWAQSQSPRIHASVATARALARDIRGG